ncbi:hypothetical protein ACFX19_028110 [Malus domestica]
MTIVQSFVESVEGVSNVEVDLAEKKVTITYDSDLIGPTSLIRCVEEAGRESKVYQASLYVPPRPREAERKHEIQMYRNQFFLSCLFSVPIFLFSMVLPIKTDSLHASAVHCWPEVFNLYISILLVLVMSFVATTCESIT